MMSPNPLMTTHHLLMVGGTGHQPAAMFFGYAVVGRDLKLPAPKLLKEWSCRL